MPVFSRFQNYVATANDMTLEEKSEAEHLIKGKVAKIGNISQVLQTSGECLSSVEVVKQIGPPGAARSFGPT